VTGEEKHGQYHRLRFAVPSIGSILVRMTTTLPEALSRPSAAATRPRSVTFDPEAHLDATLAILCRVAEFDPVYPPVRPARRSSYMYAEWLTGDRTSCRWAGLVNGEVAGHAAIGQPYPYLTASLAALGQRPIASNGFLEIRKIFVAPEARGLRLGRQLFSAARMYAWASAQQPVLAVAEASSDARRFFATRGMVDVGGAEGHYGPVRILVDPAPPAFIASW
jgi:GNAT superfamily N-acetyltransferase